MKTMTTLVLTLFLVANQHGPQNLYKKNTKLGDTFRSQIYSSILSISALDYAINVKMSFDLNVENQQLKDQNNIQHRD